MRQPSSSHERVSLFAQGSLRAEAPLRQTFRGVACITRSQKAAEILFSCLLRSLRVPCGCHFYPAPVAVLVPLAPVLIVPVPGVAVATRMLNAATTHYTRTLARPGTALPSRPMPLSGSSALWDSLTGNICELVANVASASSDAQKAFTQGGAVKSLIELVPILCSARAMTVAQGQPSLTFATEQVRPTSMFSVPLMLPRFRASSAPSPKPQRRVSRPSWTARPPRQPPPPHC